MRSLLFYSVLLLSLSAYSKRIQIIQKEIVRLLEVNPQIQLNIQNHNGDLNFEIWQKNEVEIRVVIEVETPKVKYLNRYIEAINIKETKNDNQYNFTSIVDRSKLDMSFSSGRSKYRIHYFIKHPVYLNIKLQNKYGDIMLDEISGNVHIVLNNGKLHINNITTDETKPFPRIILNYAKGVINKTQFLEADMYYSKLIVNDAKSINLNSQNSNIDIKKSYLIKIRASYDQYFIDNVSKIYLKSNYSEFIISQINDYADLFANYGSIRINKISAEFVEGTFDVSYLQMNIRLSYEACIKLNSSIIYGDLILPKRANVDQYISLKDIKTTGTIGCLSGASSKIDIRAEFSNIVISE